MIDRLVIQNFKCLKGVELRLSPLHVLIGPNDSGKSSILEAVLALSRSADVPLSEAFVGPWEGRELVWMGNDTPVCFDLNDNQYVLAIQFPTAGRAASVRHERVFGKDVPSGNERTYVCFAAGDRLPGGRFDAMATNMYAQLSGAHFFRWIPKLLSLPSAPDPSRRFRMDPTGFGLAMCLDDILGWDRTQFERLETRFRRVFSQVKSIKLQQSPAFRAKEDLRKLFPVLEPADGKMLFFEMEGNPNLVPASEVSDGILLVLAYLTVLYLPQPPHFLLVEEPENGIHPARLREILQILKDIVHEQNRTQVLMTTHSPYVLDLLKPEEVSLCSKDNTGAVKVTRLSNSPAVRKQIDVFTLGEIWTGEGDEALAKDGVGSQ